MTDSLTAALAQFVASPTFGSECERAYAIAKTGMTDTIGTMMAGANEPVVDILMRHFESVNEPAQAPLPYFDNLLKPTTVAACLNATTGHALDYDDVALAGHPSVVLTAAILAQGHLLQITGEQALKAYIVGYEVWAELIAREPGKYHLKGWHPTAVLGVVGAAASVAYLNGLDAQQSSVALAIAASMASGLVANFGSMTKPYHAGRAAANAIEAVQLAQLGMTASPDVFEHGAGYLNALSVEQNADRTSPASRLGRELRILETGLSIKRYPVCYSCHRVIDGTLSLANEYDLQADDVQSVHVTLGPAQALMLRNHRPQTGLEAKFSIEFAIASAIVAREVGLLQLTDEFVRTPQIQALFETVTSEINDKPCPLEPAFAYSDRVTITLKDGRVLESGEIRFPLGNAENPMSEADLRAKFLDCCAYAKSMGVARMKSDPQALYERLLYLERLDNLQRLFESD